MIPPPLLLIPPSSPGPRSGRGVGRKTRGIGKVKWAEGQGGRVRKKLSCQQESLQG